MKPTIWVLGDQLNRHFGALARATPDTHRVLMVESQAKLLSKSWHIQRAHFVISSMRHFARELSAEGFVVDYRQSTSLAAGLREHQSEHSPTHVTVSEPASFDGLVLVKRLGCRVERSDQFLCHYEDFRDHKRQHLTTRKTFKMEDFYRWQRRRLNYLMTDDGEPETGQWNYDSENREPAPKDGINHWPEPLIDDLDDIDLDVIDMLRPLCTGDRPSGLWATTRTGALGRLQHFIDHLLPVFGPHEDAMTTASWHLAHSLLSPYLNIGLLHPREVCDAVEAEYRAGRVPIASAEGFLRQVIGWREFVWGTYWELMPDYRIKNELKAHHSLPVSFTSGHTDMRCLSTVLTEVRQHAWAHHIQRLMVLGNLSLIAGVDPWQLNEWFWANFVDGAEWVMIPNVIGMSQYADGGVMATKPYASGGAYIHRMSDYCTGCAYDRTKRVGADACPFTTLYWDFMSRHEQRFARNPRVSQQVRAAQKLADISQVREQAVKLTIPRLISGEL